MFLSFWAAQVLFSNNSDNAFGRKKSRSHLIKLFSIFSPQIKFKKCLFAIVKVEEMSMEDYKPALGRFTWKVENFTKLTDHKCYSDIFTVDGCKW